MLIKVIEPRFVPGSESKRNEDRKKISEYIFERMDKILSEVNRVLKKNNKKNLFIGIPEKRFIEVSYFFKSNNGKHSSYGRKDLSV